jgi:hypothetical protein
MSFANSAPSGEDHAVCRSVSPRSWLCRCLLDGVQDAAGHRQGNYAINRLAHDPASRSPLVPRASSSVSTWAGSGTRPRSCRSAATRRRSRSTGRRSSPRRRTGLASTLEPVGVGLLLPIWGPQHLPAELRRLHRAATGHLGDDLGQLVGVHWWCRRGRRAAGLLDPRGEVGIGAFTLLATTLEPALDRVEPQALGAAGVGKRHALGVRSTRPCRCSGVNLLALSVSFHFLGGWVTPR